MLRTLIAATFLCLCLIPAKPLHAETLNFNDIYYDPGSQFGFGSYSEFNFYLFSAFEPSSGGIVNLIPNDNTRAIFAALEDYQVVPNYGPGGIDGTLPPPPGGDPLIAMWFPDFYTTDGSTFTLNSMRISLVQPDLESILILGYEDDQLVDYTTNSGADPTTGLLTLNWTGINGVVFSVDEFDTEQLFLDDITVNEPIGAAPTPEPSTLTLVGTFLLGLIAAARRRARAN